MYIDDVLHHMYVCMRAYVPHICGKEKLALSVQINKRGKNLLIECNEK